MEAESQGLEPDSHSIVKNQSWNQKDERGMLAVNPSEEKIMGTFRQSRFSLLDRGSRWSCHFPLLLLPSTFHQICDNEEQIE